MITGKQQINGFTLLEVLLAMSLLSIMMVLLFSSLRVGTESWHKGEEKIAQVSEKAVVYQFFRRHLPMIKPLWDDFSEQDYRHFSFQGEESGLRFVSVFPASANRKGLQLFEIAFDQSDNGIIKIAITPFYPSVEEQPWESEKVTLLDNVESLNFEFFDKQDDDKGEWVKRWQNKDYLPSLIKIKIILADESDWPEMIFALKQAAFGRNDHLAIEQ